MKITKLGHSCLLVEEGSARILTDPGIFSTGVDELTGIDAILITHEHPDHCFTDNIYKIMGKNPSSTVYTNSGTAEVLKKAGVPYRILDHEQSATVKDVTIEGFGIDHNVIHESLPVARNTGFLIGGRLYHPGDSYTVPNKSVEILALPTGGPWLKVSDTVEYAKQVKPKSAFPIHDGMLNDSGQQLMNTWADKLLSPTGVAWTVIPNGESKEF